jgi:hypothetical protein
VPHAGLIEFSEIGPERFALQRARLHIRAGKRRLRQGKIAAGIVTLFDALEFALEWHTYPPRREKLRLQSREMTRSRKIFDALNRAGVLDGSFDFDRFDTLLERALFEEMPGYDFRELVAGVEKVMTQLGVMPYDETSLPPEEPATF